MFVIWGALHGIAIVIHRAWQQMGQKMNTVLAWFITFNFINITWIFFRAKDWTQASNIINGMMGGNGIMLPEKYAKYVGNAQESMLKFGTVYEHINGKSQTTTYIILGFIMVLVLKNSMQLVDEFKPNRFNLIFTILIFMIALSMMSRVSEFLYFNF